MHRVRSLAAQCVRDLARSRCSGGAAGAVGAVDRLVRSNAAGFLRPDTRLCLHSSTAATAEGAGTGVLQTDKQEDEQNGQDLEDMEEGQHQQQSQRADNAISLVKRLNNLDSVNDPYASQEGVRLLEAGRARGIRDLQAYNAVFRLLSVENKNGEIIMRLAQQMEEDGVAPDLDTYNFIIYGYASNKDPLGAQRAFEELLASRLDENETTLSNMVIAHSWGNVEDMKRYFNVLGAKKMRPSRAAYNSMISGLHREQNWGGIRTILEEMQANGLAPTEPGWAVGFLAARKLGDPVFAKNLLERRSQAGMPPRQDFYANVMVTLGEANKPEAVLEYWRHLVCMQGMRGVDIKPETFFLALRSAAKAKAWDEVEAIIGMMQENGIPMGERLHNTLIGRQQDVRDPMDVERLISVLAQMGRGHGDQKLTPLSRLHLAGVCAGAKMYDTAMPLFESARNAGVYIGKPLRQPLLQTLLAVGKLEEVRDQWKQATWLRKKEFTGSIYSLFMKAAARLEDADMALELHTRSLKGNKSNTRSFHPTAVQILAEAGRLEEAFAIAESLRTGGSSSLPKLPPGSYHTLCRCCKKGGDKELVVKVVQTMRRGNSSTYLPPPDVIGFVVEAFTESGNANEVISLFDRMRAQNIQPDPDVYVLLADAAVAADDRAKAALFVRLAEEKGGLGASARAVAFAQGNGSGSGSGSGSSSGGSSGSSSPSPKESTESTT